METTERPQGWAVAGWALGALTLVGGLTWLLLNMPGPRPTDVLAGLVLAGGGLVLLMQHRMHLPTRLTSAAAVGSGLAGTLASLAVGATQTAHAYEYAFEAVRGWPFRWLDRGGVAADADTARRLALDSSWHVDAIALLGDLLFWAYAGILVVAASTTLRGIRAGSAARRATPA